MTPEALALMLVTGTVKRRLVMAGCTTCYARHEPRVYLDQEFYYDAETGEHVTQRCPICGTIRYGDHRVRPDSSDGRAPDS